MPLLSTEKTKTIKSELISSLADFVESEFLKAKDNRQITGINKKMLDAQRTYNLIYSPEILAEIRKLGGSEVFRSITAEKCDSLQAWLNDVLLTRADENFWSLTNTPIPDLSQKDESEVVQKIIEKYKPLVDSGADIDEYLPDVEEDTIRLKEEQINALRNKAKKIIKSMEAVMSDQLVDGDFEEAIYDFFHYFSLYPTAFLKGPVIRIEKRLSYDAESNPEVKDKVILRWTTPSPFDIYPSSDATTVQNGRLFEVVRYTREELNLMKTLPNYSVVSINKVLSSGFIGKADEIIDGYINTERKEVENRPNAVYTNKTYYEGIEMYGPVSGVLLQEWGIKVPDKYASYEAHVIKVGNNVIKATLNENPLSKRPYYQASFKKIPNAFWGKALPKTIEDIQQLANSCMRALANNMSFTSGPIVMYDLAQVPPEEDMTSIYPYKVIPFDGRMSMNTRQPVEFYQASTNASELLSVYERLRSDADNVTQIPSFASGSTDVRGAGTTASGLSILQGNLTKGIKEHILSISKKVLLPALKSLYNWNMLYNPNKEIKGDCEIIVQGPLKVITKEQKAIRINELLQITSNPIDMQIIGTNGRTNLLREVFNTNDITTEGILPNKAELPYAENNIPTNEGIGTPQEQQ